MVHTPLDVRSMSEQHLDYPSTLLRLYHQSQGIHKGAKKAEEELIQHLQTTNLPVECYDLLLSHFLYQLKGDGATKLLRHLLASNLLRTTDLFGVNYPPHQLKILLSILPESIEKWCKIVEIEDKSMDLNLRDGVFVPNSILQNEKIAQKTSQMFAMNRLGDMIAQIARHTDDQVIVVFIARTFQMILKHGKKSSIQNIFVRLADVFVTWTKRVDIRSNHRDEIVRALFDMKELWSDNTVYSLSLVSTFARDIEKMATDTLTSNELIQLNSIVMCFMAIANGLQTLVITTDNNILRRVLHSLTTLGDKYIFRLETLHTCAQSLVSIAQLSSSLFDSLCLPAVEVLMLHATMLYKRHLATSMDLSSIFDHVLALLEISRVQFTLPLVNMLTRRLPDALPYPYGVPSPLAPLSPSTHRSSTYLTVLTTQTQANLLLKFARICIEFARLGGIPILQVFALESVSPVASTEQIHFTLMVFAVSLTTTITLMPGDADCLCLAGIYGRLVQALQKWTGDIFLNGAKALQCLLQFMIAYIQPPLKEKDSMTLINLLFDRLSQKPEEILFEIINLMTTNSKLFHLPQTIEAPASLSVLSKHPSEHIRMSYMELLESISPSPQELDIVVNGLFDNSRDVSLKAINALGHRVVSRLGQTSYRKKKPSTCTLQNIEFDSIAFETVIHFIDNGDSMENCLRKLKRGNHPTPLLAIKASIWNAANWCVYNRLRTHWGNAGQTFAAIEKLLLKNVRHPRLLVEFVHALEMEIIHMNDETNEEHAKTITFFKTNRRVCEDWLLRIRPAIIRLCETTGSSSLSRHHALSLVTNLSRKPASFEWDSAMYDLCCACYDLQDTPGLHGYIEYARKLNQLKPWMEPLQHEAHMRYEAAVGCYQAILSPFFDLSAQHCSGLNLQFDSEEDRAAIVSSVEQLLTNSTMSGQSYKGIMMRCASCLAYLQDWTACQEWMEKVLDLATFLSNVQNCTSKELDIVTGMVSIVPQWEKEINMLQHKYTANLPPLQEWSVLSIVDDANFRQIQPLNDSKSHLAFLHNKLRVLNLDERACTPRKGENMSRELQRTLMHVQCFIKPEVSPYLTLDPTAHDLGVWHPLATRQESFDFDLQIIRLARKQTNFNLVERKLKDLNSTSPVKEITLAYEQAQLYRALNEKEAARNILEDMHQAFSNETLKSEKRIHVKTLIKLASWSEKNHQQQYYLQLATELDPQSHQAWLSWSDFSYNTTQNQLNGMQNHHYSLSIEEKQEFTTILDTYPEIQSLASILLSNLQNFESFDSLNLSGPVAQQLTLLYQKARGRVLSGYSSAIVGYITYLSCASQASLHSHGVIVTLRLLSILVKRGSEPSMQHVLDMVVRDSPLEPWERIVPQLLSRLAHPDTNASSRIEGILIRLASHSPHLIVYPAVVESTTLTEALNPDLVSQTQQLISEFRRISVLWDEAWIALLTKLSSEIDRRSHTLEKEAMRVNRNATLSTSEKIGLAQRKYIAMMKPVLLALNTLAETTIEIKPATPHEHWFMLHFGEHIRTGLIKFEQFLEEDQGTGTLVNKKSTDSLVHHVWSPFADILQRLRYIIQRRQSIPIAKISPVLETWHSTSVHMPGLPRRILEGVSPLVQILSTKTKPKCFELIGSDGEMYRYLLKAREDLHLDERIMQLLNTVNDCLSADKEAMHYDLTARHYNVIPLSNDAGLIQMVRNVTPLFQIYTTATNTINVAPTVPFYSKLKEYGIVHATPLGRSQWDMEILRQVYLDLVNEQPKTNILLQEMMGKSKTIQEYGAKTSRFTRSLAVMSVVGYIIGLGDRHLDNMLLCQSGDLVHIDYNVCFDKGKKLKVPEIVPFRLTRVLHGALGISGTEGRFRHSMETTLRVMRTADTKETILTLLEAFVYDPLVDWKKGSTPKKLWRMEFNVQLSLFSSRVQERRTEAEAALAHVLSDWKQAEFLFNSIVKSSQDVIALYKEFQAVQANEIALNQRLDQLVSEKIKNESEDDEIEKTWALTSHDINRFQSMCQARERDVRQWLEVPELGLRWDINQDFNSIGDACGDVLNEEEMLQCQVIDQTYKELATYISDVHRQIYPAFQWYKEMRQVLYSQVRGPTVYEEWNELCTLAQTDQYDMKQLKAKYEGRLEHVKQMTVPCSIQNVEEPPSHSWHIDIDSIKKQFETLGYSLTEMKTEWKLSNAQAQKAFRLAIALHWLDEKYDEEDDIVQKLTSKVYAACWLYEMGNCPRSSLKNLPVDEWLNEPFTSPSKHPQLAQLHTLVSTIHTIDLVFTCYMNHFDNPPLSMTWIDSFQETIDSAYAMPQWNEVIASMDWMERTIPVKDLKFEIPTKQAESLWELPGARILGYLVNNCCTIEIELTKDGNIGAIQYFWIKTFILLLKNLIIEKSIKKIKEIFLEKINSLIYLGINLFPFDIYFNEWKFKSIKKEFFSLKYFELEWKNSMPIDIIFNPISFNILKINEIILMIYKTYNKLIQKEKENNYFQFYLKLNQIKNQKNYIIQWLTSKNKIILSRNEMFLIFPNLDHIRQCSQFLLTNSNQLKIILNWKKQNGFILNEKLIQNSFQSIQILTQHVDALGISFRWIQFIESSFRDSNSTTCHEIDREGFLLLEKYINFKNILKKNKLNEIKNEYELNEELNQIKNKKLKLKNNLFFYFDTFQINDIIIQFKNLIPELLKKNKMDIIWENQRLIKILSKSIKRHVDELSELQSNITIYETKCSKLYDLYCNVLDALEFFLKKCPNLEKKSTMASIVRGNEHAKDDISTKYALLDALNQFMDRLNDIQSIKPWTEQLIQIFFQLADQAIVLSNENPNLSESESESEDEIYLQKEKVQERNEYGIQVLNMVKKKLNGDELNYSIEKQIEWLIQEATSIENLSSMYEGWTPWI